MYKLVSTDEQFCLLKVSRRFGATSRPYPQCRRISQAKTSVKQKRRLTFNGLKKKLNSVALVRKRTIPTERPPLVGEFSASLCEQRVLRGQRNAIPRPLISVF
jgi:hypothetical protein